MHGEPPPDKPSLTPEQLTQLRAELEQLRQFRQLAVSIMKNSKGEVLLTALRRGFAAASKAQEIKGVKLQQKAVAYGAEPELFADIVKKGYLPNDRAEGCEDEYAQKAWQRLAHRISTRHA